MLTCVPKKCSGCYCYWTPDKTDVKTSGQVYNICKRCRSKKKRQRKKCLEPDCNKIPTYNYTGETTAIYCSAHKKEGMEDIKHKKCLEPGCITRPTYNNPGEKTAIYCNAHKKPEMIDILSKRCLEPGCNKHPAYNNPGEKTAIYCNAHKKPEMINIKNKRCLEPGCITRPTYNNPGEKIAIYCNAHKKPEMIDILSKRCLEPDCNKIPTYNYTGETTAIYCNAHKKPEMINVKDKRCSTPLCDQIAILDNYCIRCFHFNNPDDKRVKKYKSKENETVNYIKQEFNGLNLITDKALIGDKYCIKSRPDILINLNNHSIIIEVDEHQHKGIDYTCDEARVHNIQEALDRKSIFIRFNPDAYTNSNKIRVQSCFKSDKKTGLNTIPKQRENDWFDRLKILKKTVMEHLEYNNEEPLKIIKLFYDGYNQD